MDEPARAAVPAPVPAPWRLALDAMLGRQEPDPEPTRIETQLGLQLELRVLLPRTTYRWNGPPSRAMTKDDDPDTVRLAAHPVARTATGWARRDITWAKLPHLQHRLGLDPAQQRWFLEFAALASAASPTTAARDGERLLLDEFANPLLWALFDQAAAAGVPIVPVGAKGSVLRPGPLELGVDVIAAADGTLVHPELRGTDGPIARGHVHPIGDHGVYRFDPAHPNDVLLAPLTAPLTPATRPLLPAIGSDAVAVPASSARRFAEEDLPLLRARLEVRSSDGSIALPPPEPATLVLTARHRPRNTIETEWRWEGSGPRPAIVEVLPAEAAPADLLFTLREGVEDAALPAAAVLADVDAARFAAEVIPALERLPGVRVETTGRAPAYREIREPPVLTVTTVPSERTDWFDLGVVVTVEGRTVPFGSLFRALASGRRRMLLADGAYLALRHPAFAPLTELIEESKTLPEWRTRPVLSRYRTALWAEFEDTADETAPSAEWREVLREAAADAPSAVAVPHGLRAELRPYQRDGLAWLAFLQRNALGGVLADDMGLGKTLQTLALVQHTAEHGEGGRRPFLVVAPTSVVGNWAAEAARFTPGLITRVVPATEAASGRRIADLAVGADLVLTSYALFRLDFDAYQDVARHDGWAALVLDEAQFVKNAASRVHACALDLDVRTKLALTGTPLENSLTELHAILAIVAPGLLPSARRFAEEYVRPIEQPPPGIARGRGGGSAIEVPSAVRAERLERLRRRIRPFLLRRTKEQVAPELPPKQEQVLRVELDPAHRARYDVWLQRERQKLFGLLEDLDRNRFIVFRSLTLLRMLALDASLIDPEDDAVPSAKLDVLQEQLEDVLAEGHRALVFSSFTSYLRRAEQRLAAAGIRTAYLDGTTRRRTEAVSAFTEGDAQVFLISLKAGGFGLNLTGADYVFLLDPWWNPAAEAQAVDRTHRIGQRRPVLVYRLVATDTIEEKVVALQRRKAALFDAVLGDGQQLGAAITADDVRELLG